MSTANLNAEQELTPPHQRSPSCWLQAAIDAVNTGDPADLAATKE